MSMNPRDETVLSRVRVLLVDDCKLVRATVAAMLEYFGAVVTAVGSADEALEAVEREHPDVLLSDLAMRSEEHTSELQSLRHLVCRLLLEKKNKNEIRHESDRPEICGDRLVEND